MVDTMTDRCWRCFVDISDEHVGFAGDHQRTVGMQHEIVIAEVGIIAVDGSRGNFLAMMMMVVPITMVVSVVHGVVIMLRGSMHMQPGSGHQHQQDRERSNGATADQREVMEHRGDMALDPDTVNRETHVRNQSPVRISGLVRHIRRPVIHRRRG